MPVPLLRLRCSDAGEPGEGEHGQGDVGVPGPLGADLVLVQAGLVLGLLEAFLDPPARPGDRASSVQRGAAGSVADVVGDLGRVADGAAGQQPVPAPGCPGDPDRDPRPVVVARAVRAVAGRDPPPLLRAGPRRSAHRRDRRGRPVVNTVVVAAGGQHIRRRRVLPARPAGT